MDLDKKIDLLIEKINSLHSGLIDGNWKRLDRNAFVSVLEKIISELQEIKLGIKEIHIASTYKAEAPDASKVLEEFDRTINVLERNLSLEKNKSEKQPKFDWKEEAEIPELYNSLEQKVLSLILKARYFVEKMLIFEKKHESSIVEFHPTGKALMDLLKQKESEIELLREKYENVRKKSFIGLAGKEDAVDLEHEMIGFARNLETNFVQTKQELGQLGKEFNSMQHNFNSLKQKNDSLHQSMNAFVEKNLELSASLKKERDYSKKLMIEVENETLQLRNQYTKEILNLQEAKLAAKTESDEKHSKTIKALQKELKEKNELLKNLNETASHQLKKIIELEGKNNHLKALIQTKEKHEAVKKMFKGKK